MAILATWDGVLGEEPSLEIFGDLALRHCQLAGKDADELARLISARDYKGICAYEVDYNSGLSIDTVLHIRQALGFFTKLPFLDIGIDKEAAAVASFMESEGECCKTNFLLNLSASDDFSFPLDVQRVIKRAERKIADVLGEVPSLKQLDLLFGPGATTSVKRRNACAREKLSAVPSCSTNMLPLIPQLYEELPSYLGHFITESSDECESDLLQLEIHTGKLAFVPKNAKSMRSVMTEPTLNALVQGGFGRYISQRLRSVGQDTRDQSRNKALARSSSVSGALATLDLSRASDSISYELVALLLPYEWFAALALCRTPSVRLPDGKVLHLHKFSSMGNGYTFPLQTLIFWALAKSCSELSSSSSRTVSVYGDDIIIGVDAVPLFKKVLFCTGFTLNDDKSYWSGPFRESCGGDYYFGINVRPFYAKSTVSGELLFVLHNFYFRDFRVDLASFVKSLIDPALRIYGPDGYGDGHLLDDSPLKPHKRHHGYCGYTFETYTHKSRKSFRVRPTDYVLPTYTSYERSFAPDGKGVSSISYRKVRDGGDPWGVTIPGVSGYRRIKIYTLRPT